MVAAEGPVQTVLGARPTDRVRVGLRAGSAHDPPGREGLAWVTAHAVAASVGADIGIDIGPEIVLFDVPTADAERLAAALVAPPSPEAVAGARTAALAALDRLDCRQLAERAWDAWIYAGHPYGHAPEGRRSVVPTLTAAEVAGFQAVRYVRSAAAVGLPAGVALPPGFDGLPARLSASPVPALRLPLPAARTFTLVAEGEGCEVAGAPASGGEGGGAAQAPRGAFDARREGRRLEGSGSGVDSVVPAPVASAPVTSAPVTSEADAIFLALLQRDPWPSRSSSPRPPALSAALIPDADSVRTVRVLPPAEAAASQASQSPASPSLTVEELLR